MDLDLDAPGLVGRTGVWAELIALLERDRRDGSGALVLGAAGIGKSALVEQFAAHARSLGFPVRTASGETGAEPYAGLRALFSEADLADLPPGQRQALGTALAARTRGTASPRTPAGRESPPTRAGREQAAPSTPTANAASPDGRGRTEVAARTGNGGVTEGAAEGEPRVDLLALRAAVCSVCSVLAGELPLVLVVDDVDRVDAPTLDLLITVASVLSWRQLPVIALFASRTERVPVELAELLRQIPVPALTDREAERLLDRLAAPGGSARLEILRRAAGNPLALHEYGAGIPERDRAAGGGLAAGTPTAEGTVSERTAAAEGGVTEVFARRVRDLPEMSRRALTLAAAGERSVAVLSRAEPALTPAVWQPAEEAGLVTVVDAVVRFRHPLVEFAVLDAAGAGARRRAHRMLAEATADPRRALWHRAEAADGTDPKLAAELIAAARPLNGAAAVTAVGLLEQACDLLPLTERAPVLLEAGVRAGAIGRIRWAADILARARAVPGVDPALRASTDAFASWVLTMRGRVTEAADLLVAALNEYTAPHLPGSTAPAQLGSTTPAQLGSTTSTDVTGTASLGETAEARSELTDVTGTVNRGETAEAPDELAAVTGEADRGEAVEVPGELVETSALPAFLLGYGPLSDALTAVLARAGGRRLFPAALLRPDDDVRAAILAVPEPVAAGEIGPAAAIGAGAMLLDEPEQALRLLGPAVRAVREGTAASAFLTAPGAAAWALIDTGRWVEAEGLLVPLLASPALAEASMVRAGAEVQLAVIRYGRGRLDTEHEPLGSTPLEHRRLDARRTEHEPLDSAPLEHGRLDSGRTEDEPLDSTPPEHGRLDSGPPEREPFGSGSPERGLPAMGLRLYWARGVAAAAGGDHAAAYRWLRAAAEVRHPWQPLVLPDLIIAARHDGRAEATRDGHERMLTSYRKAWLTGRQRIRLAAAAALLIADPAESAERLAAVLATAGAERWPFERAVLAVELADRLRRAQQPTRAKEVLVGALDTFERLRAAAWAARVHAELRIAVPAADGPDFAALTAQQEQIVRLAARGLTNREIGERLFLSPRTVGSHLYRLFPQLGVTNRTQLGELVAAVDRTSAG
ncbi:DNA-binding NarL/FixJ family response regulator [Actinoplanes octamycinicus]|uniref:DNA-binding NarL/FixJ family response regulator n=1 Tax=Actinoplanes octamycinicus TaxID=135948 RepID=A0A7W7M4H2_9ACTN|nr:AAA family ATPase [Actinoplanes octamycinicus]MBB4736684.1 DNA-binding NarL/FixJ family response regulator [Actinoplanes octamycinicus]